MRKIQSIGETIAYVIDHNKRRLIILLLIVGLILTLSGARAVVEGIVGFIGSAPSLLVTLLFSAFALIMQFGALMWFMARPRKYTVTPDHPQIGLSFADYRGQPELLEYARSLVRILKGVERFQRLGGEMPKGMLLGGPPGTGKTFLAGVIAAEAGLPFIYIDASSLSSMFMGVDGLIVVSLFSQARKLGRKYAAPGQQGACILFIDELDAVGMSRGGGGQGQGQVAMGGMMGMGFRGMALNTMLNQMDSLGAHVEDRWGQKLLRWLGVVRGPVPKKPVVFVIGATNRPEVLDAALTRPGRLDRKLMVYAPDGPGRKDILEHYLTLKAHDPKIDTDLMVSDSLGWTPIEIKTIINEALIIAHDDGRDFLTYKDWLSARDVRMLGLKQPVRLTPADKRAIAYHEAGHAVVSHYLRPQDRTQKLSIIRMGDALGVHQFSPIEERYTRHAVEIETDIMSSLGSRAVEEVILGTKMAGASSDLQHATTMALAYIGSLGMGPSLLANVTGGMGGYSEPVLRQADALLDQLYEETKRLIREKEFAVHALAGALLERQELIGSELTDILAFAEEAHPESAGPFARKPVLLPKVFEPKSEREVASARPDEIPLAASGPARPAPGR